MRLAIITLDFAPDIGGVQTFLYEVASRLGRDDEVQVITGVSGQFRSKTPFSIAKPSPQNALGFWRVLRRFQPECILVGHAHPQLLAAAALTAPTRYATLAHGNDYLAAQRRWHRPAFNYLLARSRPLLTVSYANSEQMRHLGLPKPLVVHPGTDPHRFTPPEHALPETRPILLTVGRLVPRKGIDIVLQALPQVLEVYPTLLYRIAGHGPDEQRLRALTAQLCLEHAVQFVGVVPPTQLPDLYRDAQIFVMPSREEQQQASIEGFGITYLEASASGLPVVAGRSGGAVEAVRDGETGFLVNPHDPKALANKLICLLQDRRLRGQLGSCGRKWIETEMNWDRAAREIRNALEHPI